jgi:hypothetical protein
MKQKFTVEKREIHTVEVEVLAESPSEALSLVKDGQGTEVEGTSEYNTTVDPYGVGPMNVYQWRVYGPGCDSFLGMPASTIEDD